MHIQKRFLKFNFDNTDLLANAVKRIRGLRREEKADLHTGNRSISWQVKSNNEFKKKIAVTVEPPEKSVPRKHCLELITAPSWPPNVLIPTLTHCKLFQYIGAQIFWPA